MKTNMGQWVNQSQTGRILILGLLIIVFQIPINSIERIVNERRSTESTAINEVQQKWGGEQSIIGPMLVVPYKVKHFWKDAYTGKKETKIEIHRAVFLPEELNISSQLVNETRYRGIFEVPLYQTSVKLQGLFINPDFKQWEIADEDIIWNKARLLVLVSDARAIQKQAIVNWNGKDFYFAPGTDESTANSEGYHVDLTVLKGSTENYNFSIQLILNGSQGLYFAPLGKDSLVNISAPWPDPSFQGKWLPTSRQISEKGFTSQWQIPYLGRNYSQQTQNFSLVQDNIKNSLVGVALISPVDNYRMTERSIKYVVLFLSLTFILIWLVELVAKLKVHFIQYLFIGAGLCIFYLLELSLSEHIGFYWAYVIATAAIISMVSMYSYVVLHTGKRVAIISASLATMYVYLFTLLQEQNYSLLIGSVGLFIMLGCVMYVTRHIDWTRITDQALNSKPKEQV